MNDKLESKNNQQLADLFYREGCKGIIDRIKSGKFNAADIKAGVELLKLAGVEISLSHSDEGQGLTQALLDADTGESFDPTKPPEFKVVNG